MKKGKIIFTVWLSIIVMFISGWAGFMHNVSLPVIIIRVLITGCIFAGIGLGFSAIWEAFSNKPLNSSLENNISVGADDSNFKETLGKKIDFRLEREMPGIEPVRHESRAQL